MGAGTERRMRASFERLSVYRGGFGKVCVHALAGLFGGFTLLVEPPGGYTIPVYTGPIQLVSWLPWDGFHIWGALFMVCGFLVLRGNGGRSSIWPLVALGTTWMLFGSSALYVGLTNDQAGSLGGIVFIAMAFGAVLRAVEIAHWLQITSNYDDSR